ncbi:SGNH/GDSL hydrolase family protein [Bacillus sp. FDAARGOS_1420]|uniref:SGNH/GDSL hydrolase family protein n=1 Tax=unclassified Bacillus (in: firmicutes) TaxID=185979 RepID=UPI001C5BA3C4|nr:SGNH/GDSL hydrolase family protein [Bacillus sp. FDAARGOS_1420]MBW3496684.1 SGNH/GDSL hydrolase family protein [Bacillus sp. FDAARGOS_1420]
MNKRAWIGFTICVLFVVVLVCGQLHWREKITRVTNEAIQKKSEIMPQEAAVSVSPNYETYIKNLPDVVKDKVKRAVLSGKLVHLVIVGDQATASSREAWPIKVAEQMKKTYGNGVWNITVREWEDESTADLLSNKRFDELIALHPDVILFQPPFLTDNNRGGNRDSVTNLDQFLKRVTEILKDTTLIIQPPNPIHNAINYPNAISELQQYAEQHQYIYLDHWTSWPNQNSGAILPYLQNEHGFPNIKGHELWAQYINTYFVGE